MIWRVAFAALLVLAAGEKRSGYQDASPETRAMQDDDASNPGFLWVQQGEALWSERAGSAGRSCADCHGAAPVAMRGVAARYPVSMRVSVVRSRWRSASNSAASSDRAPRHCRRTAMRCWDCPRLSGCSRAGCRCR